MSYHIIQPPFTLKFTEMTTKQLKDYFAWFQSITEERTKELAAYIQQDPAMLHWKADCSPSSLDGLGEWFFRHVSTRERSAEELDAIKARLSFPIDVPGYELTNESFSLAFDVGIYFGLTLMNNHPSLRWDQDLKKKQFADYGQPIIVGFDALSLNPVRVGVNFAYAFASGKGTGSRIREVYEVWSGHVPPIN